MFREWRDILPGQVDVLGVRYPGRETLMRQPPLRDMQELVASLQVALEPLFDRPFAFFGHSMGSWVAFELARGLARAKQSEPSILFVSARRAPHVAERHPPIGELEDQALIEAVQERYGGIPDAVLAEPELLALVLPALRADLQLLEAYQFSADQPLSCPIQAYGGERDSQVTREDIRAWGEHTSGPFGQLSFSGSHFFLNEPAGPRLRASIAQAILQKFAVRPSL